MQTGSIIHTLFYCKLYSFIVLVLTSMLVITVTLHISYAMVIAALAPNGLLTHGTFFCILMILVIESFFLDNEGLLMLLCVLGALLLIVS